MAQSNARLTGDEEAVGLIPAGSGNIVLLKMIMKSFLQSFPSADSRRAVVSFW